MYYSKTDCAYVNDTGFQHTPPHEFVFHKSNLVQQSKDKYHSSLKITTLFSEVNMTVDKIELSSLWSQWISDCGTRSIHYATESVFQWALAKSTCWRESSSMFFLNEKTNDFEGDFDIRGVWDIVKSWHKLLTRILDARSVEMFSSVHQIILGSTQNVFSFTRYLNSHEMTVDDDLHTIHPSFLGLTVFLYPSTSMLKHFLLTTLFSYLHWQSITTHFSHRRLFQTSAPNIPFSILVSAMPCIEDVYDTEFQECFKQCNTIAIQHILGFINYSYCILQVSSWLANIVHCCKITPKNRTNLTVNIKLNQGPLKLDTKGIQNCRHIILLKVNNIFVE